MSKNANLDAVNAARAQGDFQNALLLVRRFGLDLEPLVLAERSLDESERASDSQQKERLAREAIDHCKTVLAKDGTHREALMLSGRAMFRVGDYDDAVKCLRAAALLRGGAASATTPSLASTASTSTAASLRETRQVLLALSVLASLMMRAKELDVAKQCYERILTLSKTQAGSVAQMAAADPSSLGAIESALFQLPRLEKLSGGSAAKIVATMRNALAAPIRLSRNGAAMRALLLHELAHMLLVSVAEAKYDRFDVPTIAGEVGASAAAARRFIPQDVAEETLTLLRLALAEQRLSDVSLASRTVDAVADDLCLTLLRRTATHELVDVTEYAVRSRAPCDPFAQLQARSTWISALARFL
jgi:tetratricopeptide (TPR) repeat protein